MDVLNRSAGLAYSGGDEKSYLITLREFKSVHGNYLEGIKSNLKAGDQKSACRMAHTLKSSSAFIGAEILSGISRKAETALKDAYQGSPADFDQIFSELEKAFLDVMTELDSLTDYKVSKAPFDRERAIAFTQKLLPMLEEFSAEVFKNRDETEEVFASFGDEGAELLSLIDGFEFSEAAKLLLKIKSML